MGSEYMTPNEAAELLGVTPRTVYQWIKDKHLPAAKIGGRWRVRRVDIDSLWESKGGKA